MGLFENSHFPYTNFHELNLDKIVDVTKEAKETADRAETKADQAAATVGTFDQRITENTENIDNAQDRITGVNAAVGVHSNQITDLIGQTSKLGTDIMHTNSDVNELRLRVDATEDDIESLKIDKTSCQVEQGTLDAGVLVGTVTQQLTPDSPVETIRLYAPTAGSTVVRAVDVPFNTTGVTPEMTGNTVQAAIEELNTGIAAGLGALNHQTIDPDPDNYLAYDDGDLSERYSGPNDNLEYLFEKIVNNIKGMFKTLAKNVYYDNTRDRIALNGSYYSGSITGGQSTIYIMIPYNKIVQRYDGFNYGNYHAVTNPIDNPSNYRWVLNGSITVRGVNGYILNNVDLASSSITAISCVAVESGVQIKLTIPAASGSVNNSPVNAWFSGNNPYIEFYK